MSKLLTQAAKHTVIEKTALELAAVWYEAGRGQGMTSKYKTTRAYARANFEKFIPLALNHLIDMLGRPDINDLMKQEIHAAIVERNGDPVVNAVFPGPKQDVKPLQNVPVFNPTRH